MRFKKEKKTANNYSSPHPSSASAPLSSTPAARGKTRPAAISSQAEKKRPPKRRDGRWGRMRARGGRGRGGVVRSSQSEQAGAEDPPPGAGRGCGPLTAPLGTQGVRAALGVRAAPGPGSATLPGQAQREGAVQPAGNQSHTGWETPSRASQHMNNHRRATAPGY